MKMILTVILYFVVVFQGLSPADPYRDITANKIWSEQVSEHMHQQRIDRLLTTIRTVESNDRYNVWGGSREYGAYQFTPATWRFYCYMYEGRIQDIRVPENQDRIALMKVSDLVVKGYTNEQIAAFWNSGKFDNWEARIGTNRWGVRYDTPRYVRKFMRVYYQGI